MVDLQWIGIKVAVIFYEMFQSFNLTLLLFQDKCMQNVAINDQLWKQMSTIIFNSFGRCLLSYLPFRPNVFQPNILRLNVLWSYEHAPCFSRTTKITIGDFFIEFHEKSIHEFLSESLDESMNIFLMKYFWKNHWKNSFNSNSRNSWWNSWRACEGYT